MSWNYFFLVLAHKYAQAIDLYTQAIELNGQNAVYWANRAFAHTKLEEYGSAIQDASKAIEIDPKYSKVRSTSMFDTLLYILFLSFLTTFWNYSVRQGYYRRGAAFLAMGKLKEALKDFQQVCLICISAPFYQKKFQLRVLLLSDL